MNGNHSVVQVDKPSKELQRAHTVLQDPFFFIIVLKNPNCDLCRVAFYLFTDAMETPLRLTKKCSLRPTTTVTPRPADEPACPPFPINRNNQALIFLNVVDIFLNMVNDKMQHAVNKGAAQRGHWSQNYPIVGFHLPLQISSAHLICQSTPQFLMSRCAALPRSAY